MTTLLRTLAVLVAILCLTSCSSVRVAADYDKEIDFNTFKTFAFFKTGIDKIDISDLDKRRILRAIEAELLAKGYTKSENPDVLISLFTKSQQRVDVYNNNWGYGNWGWGYGGWGFNRPVNVSTSTEGTLYIDVIDASKKVLVWQGMGTGYLSTNIEKKEERISEFVSKIMEKFPPEIPQ